MPFPALNSDVSLTTDSLKYVLELAALLGLLFLIDQIAWGFRFRLWRVMRRLPLVGWLTPMLYGFLFLPGTALHELSHLVMILLAGGHIDQVVLLPTEEDGHLTLGHVRGGGVERIFFGLSTLAPLLAGLLACYGVLRGALGVEPPAFADLGNYFEALGGLLTALVRGPLWLYLLFNFGIAGLPGRTDYHDVPRTLLLAFGFGVVIFFIAAALLPALFDADWWIRRLNVLVLAYSAVLVIDVVVYVPVRMLAAVLVPHPLPA
jgi:hypothetical protein